MSKQPVDLIAAEFGWGAQLHEAQWGPEALQKHLHLHYQKIASAKTLYRHALHLDYHERLEEVTAFSKQLTKLVHDSVLSHHFPIVFGGDHSMAIGTWNGVVSALKAQGHFGLIWIDAHMDSHTPQTSPSMAIHGMPLAALLGHGEKSLVEVEKSYPVLSPEHVILIGVRSFESGEAALLQSLNVKIVYIQEVKEKGLTKVIKEATKWLSEKTDNFGVSLDLDAFDPTIAPGVGTPELNGIMGYADIQETFNYLRFLPQLKALEIAEYNPERDHNHLTAELVKLILEPWARQQH